MFTKKKTKQNPNRTANQTANHEPNQGPDRRKVTRTQGIILGLALVPILAVGVAGGIGTYTNLSATYGSGTAAGALAAGEGATAVLAVIMLGLTVLGQSTPVLLRVGLWTLPAVAAVMAATAANGLGESIVYAATPMAITASAEGLAFLARRIVIYTDGRDADAEARNADVIRDIAYHQARADRHPDPKQRKKSGKKVWKLAAKVGTGDVALGGALVDVQRERMTAGASAALTRLYTGTTDTPAAATDASALTATSAPALPSASAGEATEAGSHDITIHADTSGYPPHTTSDQGGEGQDIRPDLKIVREEGQPKKSIAADVRDMVADGVRDVRYVIDAIAARHDRSPEEKALRDTVTRYHRDAVRAADGDATRTGQGAYL
ncbi:conjugal transfer protein [Streptomyces albidoflavus]|uniref:conjugal transfer protein n=1 Tax=Streptomyces albidoflavus TaxID=1886 RepID=UPI0033C1E7A3